MKRSEMVKRLATYMYDCNEARASDALQFLEDQGMMHHDGWDLEEELEPTPEEEVKALVKAHMGWRDITILIWYNQSNPLLGGLAPNDMVSQGRQDKLIKWIKNQIDENEMAPDVLSAMELVEPKLPQKARRKATQAKFKRHRKKT